MPCEHEFVDEPVLFGKTWGKNYTCEDFDNVMYGVGSREPCPKHHVCYEEKEAAP